MLEAVKTLWLRINTPPDISTLVAKLDRQDQAACSLERASVADASQLATQKIAEGFKR